MAAEGQGGEPVLAQIRASFGKDVALIVEALSDSLVTDRTTKDAWRARKERYLAHLEEVNDETILRVGLADKLYNARSILRDHAIHRDEPWKRFSAGADEQLWYYERLAEAYAERPIESPMVDELRATVTALRRAVESGAARGADQSPSPGRSSLSPRL